MFKSNVWLMGGLTTSRRSNDVWYSRDGTVWSEATSSAEWPARQGHTSVVFDGRLWVIGGRNNNNVRLSDVWHSTDGVSWNEAVSEAEWPGRSGHTSVVFDDRIWVIGGQGDDGFLNDVWYSTDGVSWDEATSSAEWPERHDHSSVVFDDRLWVIGGQLGLIGQAENEVYRDVWQSSDGVTWREVSAGAGWGERQSHTSAVFDDRMWVIGGRSRSGTHNDVWSSVNGVEWSAATLAAPWSARQGHSSVVFRNRMWVIGGVLVVSVWHSGDGETWTEATGSSASEFVSGFEEEDFADWDDHSCRACNNLVASIVEGGRHSPQSAPDETTEASEHRAILRGPIAADLDLFLLWWTGSEWLPVAAGTSPSADELVSFDGGPGLYRWEVRSVSGAGEFQLTINRGNLAPRTPNQLIRSEAAHKRGSFGMNSVYAPEARNSDYLVDLLPVEAGTYEVSFWIKPLEGLTVSGRKHQILQLRRGRRSIARVHLWPPATSDAGPEIAARVRRNGGKLSTLEVVQLESGEWQQIRLQWHAASAPDTADGFLRIFRGNELASSLESLDNAGHRIDRVHFGQATRSAKKTVGRVYYDDFESKWEQ